MSFKLRSPPIIEAWIRATTLPYPESEWNWGAAHEVLKSYGDALPVRERMPKFTPMPVEDAGPDGDDLIEIHVEPLCLRVRTESRSIAVQLGKNEIVVAHARTDANSTPGFNALLEGFLDALKRFEASFPIVGLAQIELHYVDLVVIPEMYVIGSSARDFFHGAPDLPSQPFGGVARVAWSHVLVAPNDIGLAQMSAELDPPDGDSGRFRLHWHFWCPGVSPHSTTTVTSRLQQAHDYLLACFRATCKDRVWQLFDPE